MRDGADHHVWAHLLLTGRQAAHGTRGTATIARVALFVCLELILWAGVSEARWSPCFLLLSFLLLLLLHRRGGELRACFHALALRYFTGTDGTALVTPPFLAPPLARKGAA